MRIIHLSNVIRVMCISALFSLVCAFTLTAAPALSQNSLITISRDNAKIEAILNDIENQSDYLFIYNENVDVSRTASLHEDAQPIKTVLNDLFDGTGIEYKMKDNHIILTHSESPSTSRSASAQQQTIVGSVKDAQGEPLIGVAVQVEGTTNGVLTDIDGNFSINASVGAKLVISCMGYQTVTAAATSEPMKIVLNEDNEMLEETVVVGYGVQKKKLVTGSTIQVSGDVIQKQNTTNAMGALYSQVPGVTITQNNGQPWSDYKITVRGLNTTGSSTPLYVIDGVAGGSISSLNPSDIESIDILKDAASAAIYGARASAGVVLVTTKQGTKGKVSVRYDGYYSFQKPNFNGVHSVTGSEYMDLVDKAFVTAGAIKEGQHYFDLEKLMPVQYAQMQAGTWNGTDWLLESVNKKSIAYNNAVSVDGGNDAVRYSFGFTNSHTEGTFDYPLDTYYDRTTVRINSDVTLWKKNGRDIIKFGENATLSSYDSNSAGTSDISTALTYTPLLPAYDSDGTYYDYEDQLRDGWDQSDGAYNLLEKKTYSQHEGRTYQLQSNLYIEVAPTSDWRFRSVYGYRMKTTHSRSYTEAYTLSGTSTNLYDDVSQSSSISTNWSWENTLSWKHSFGYHNVDALLGASIEGTGWGVSNGATRQQTKFGTWESANLSSSSSDIDAEMVSVSGSNTIPYNDLVSVFMRANYNYKEKYLFTGIIRRDGSSNFASGHRFGYFPSVSAGWNISNEPFMSGTRSWLDNLKLRASWGQNGNCSISNFQYASTVSLSAPYDFSQGNNSISTGAYPDIIPNTDLSWEKTEQTDLGIDARFFGNRLAAVFDLYQKDTKDWLVNAPSLASYGTGSPVINGGAVRNRGIEFSLNYQNTFGDLHYNIGANASYNKNKVLYIDNADGIIHGATQVISTNINRYNTFEARPGKPIGYFTGIAYDGIFQNQAQIDEYNAKGYAFIDGYENAQPGDVIWVDQNNDGIYDTDDVVEIGNPHPDYTVGLNISLDWRGFDFSLSGSGAFGQQVLQSYRQFAAGDTYNYTNNFLDRLWTGEGSTNKFPRFTYGKHNNFYCNGYVGGIWAMDADYFKIRNITVGYDIKHLFKRLPMSQCRVYFTGQNLFCFTGYDGMDPEVGYGYGYSWTSGIDTGFYPNPKAYMFGLSIKF